MSAVAEAATLLKKVAEPRPAGDTVKQAINRAARRVSRFMAQPRNEAKDELAKIDARIARLEALLVQDEDFYRDQVAQERQALRNLRGPVDGD